MAIMVSTEHRFFQLCHGGKSSLDLDMHMAPTQPSQPWQNPSLPIYSEAAGQSEQHTQEVAGTTLKQGWTIKRTDLAHPINC